MSVDINNLREFELTLILSDCESETERTQRDRVLAYYFIVKEENDGWKRLAYPIIDANGHTHEFGNYVYYEILERDNVETHFLTSLLDKDPTVLRHLLVRKQERTK